MLSAYDEMHNLRPKPLKLQNVITNHTTMHAYLQVLPPHFTLELNSCALKAGGAVLQVFWFVRNEEKQIIL